MCERREATALCSHKLKQTHTHSHTNSANSARTFGNTYTNAALKCFHAWRAHIAGRRSDCDSGVVATSNRKHIHIRTQTKAHTDGKQHVCVLYKYTHSGYCAVHATAGCERTQSFLVEEFTVLGGSVRVCSCASILCAFCAVWNSIAAA